MNIQPPLRPALNYLRPVILAGFTEFVFDWDGTVVNTLPQIRRSINAAFDALNERFALQLEHVSLAGAHKTTVLGNRVGKEAWGFTDEQDALYLETFWRTFRETSGTPEAMPGVLEFIKALPPYALAGIVSHKEGPMLRAEVKNLGLQKVFDEDSIIAYGDAPNKPDPGGVLRLYRRWGRKPGSTGIMFGDSWVDVAAGQSAGLPAALVLADPSAYPTDKPRPDMWAPDFYDYLSALKRSARLAPQPDNTVPTPMR